MKHFYETMIRAALTLVVGIPMAMLVYASTEHQIPFYSKGHFQMHRELVQKDAPRDWSIGFANSMCRSGQTNAKDCTCLVTLTSKY